MQPPTHHAPATVHALIEQQVLAAPGATAVADARRAWTYQELSDRADALAAALPEEAGPGSRIGVHVGRDVALAAAVLAVLRCGAAYVPLDPDYPRDRLRYIAEDAALTAVISDDPVVAAGLCPRVVAPDAVGAGPRTYPAVSPDDPAYVIYTSGSTGAPKGAVVPHRGVANIVRHAAAAFGFTAADSVLALASVAFDFAALEMLLPLTAGGRLHLPDRSAARDPDALARNLARHGATFLMGTPSMFAAMTGAGWRPRPGTTLVAGGEVLPPSLSRELTATCTLWNIYGPTETSIYVCCERVDPADVTIGRPVPGMTLTVLDREHGDRPAAPGAAGELCASGVGVALGYLGRPELTAARFRPLPGAPDTPVYRTGDLARIRPDGRIEYLGRLDDQVKIRGFRIELGGIEAALLAEPEVREAAVVVVDRPAGRVLTAYVVLDGQGGAAPDLRARLAARLPRHEVPHHITVLASLPRSPNGKIDRAALRQRPEPKAAPRQAAPEQAVTAPRVADGSGPLLLGIFRDVLDAPELTASDGFFDVGGDSLSALRVVSRAKAAGLHLTVTDLYNGPSVDQLARTARNTSRPAADSAPDPARPAAAVRLLPSQGWFHTLGVPEPAHFCEPVVLAARQRLDHDRLVEALDALVRRHPGLRSRVVGERVHPDGAGLPLLRFDFGPEDARFPDTLAALYRRIDPAEGRACLAGSFRGEHADTLLLVFHHLVVDGLSVQILAQDLDRLYGGEPDALGAAPVSAFAHAAALTDLAGSPEAQRDGREWLALPWGEVGTLPARAPAAGLVQADMESFGLDLDPGLSKDLLDVSGGSPVSTEEVVLAAVADSAAALGGGPTVSVDVFRHGRWPHGPEHDVSSTVGWLAQVVPHVLTSPSAAGPRGRLFALRAQIRHLRTLEPAWGALRHSAADPQVRAELARLPRPQLYLHYRGRGLTELPHMHHFTAGAAPLGAPKTPLAPPFGPVEIRFAVENDTVTSQWRYSPRVFDPGVIRALADGTLAAITAFVQDISRTEPQYRI